MEKTLEQLQAEESALWERVETSGRAHDALRREWQAAYNMVQAAEKIPNAAKLLQEAGFTVLAPQVAVSSPEVSGA